MAIKRLVEDHKRQQEKLDWMVGQFHLYLRYVHQIDITPADNNGTQSCIIKIRLVEQREEDMAQQKGDAHTLSLRVGAHPTMFRLFLISFDEVF